MVQQEFLSMLSLAHTLSNPAQSSLGVTASCHERAVIKIFLNHVLYIIFCQRKRKTHEPGECHLSRNSW